MKKLSGRLALLVTVCRFASFAQSPLQPLAFLQGCWASVQENKPYMEECWSAPHSGNVVGSFRVVQGGGIFYEFWSVDLENGQPLMLLKHFNAGLTGWESRDQSVRLTLQSSSPNAVRFVTADGSVTIDYHRHGETLVAGVTHIRQGKPDTETFNLRRVNG